VGVFFAHDGSLKNPVSGHVVEELIVECRLLPEGKAGAQGEARGYFQDCSHGNFLPVVLRTTSSCAAKKKLTTEAQRSQRRVLTSALASYGHRATARDCNGGLTPPRCATGATENGGVNPPYIVTAASSRHRQPMPRDFCQELDTTAR
jgi:hypothetical protein